MQIILNPDKREAADEAAQLLSVAAKALEPTDGRNSLTLNNAEAVALCSFLDHIARALQQLNQS